MKSSFSRLFNASLVAMALAGFVAAPVAEAREGGRGGAGERASAGARANAGDRQVNNARVDARANNVRSASSNNINARSSNVNRTTNVNASRNVNVNVDGHGGCCGGWDNDYHPVATAAAVTATVAVTAAVVGSIVNRPPANCVPVNYGGVVYQQCGSTWYQPQGSQYVVVNPPY